MNKRELIQQWREARRVLFDSLKALGEGEASIPNSIGKWSVKDVVAHIVFWDEELLRGMKALLKRDRPAFLDRDWDELNARAVAERKHQSLNEMLGDLKESGARIEVFLNGLDESEFCSCMGQKWKMWDVTIEWIVCGNVEHDKHHTQKILTWRNGHLK
ncbi:MAG: DinB family protein [bacterium]